jgi:hypothetical protein
MWLEEKSCRNIWSEKGYATIWFLISMVAITFLAGVVMTFGLQSIQQNKMKNVLNHAVKAAALQTDDLSLMQNGLIVIKQQEALEAFHDILSSNLEGRENLIKNLEVEEFMILDESGYTFPYTVERPEIRFSHTFESPGVMAVVKVDVPSLWIEKERRMYVPAVAEVTVQFEDAVFNGEGSP